MTDEEKDLMQAKVEAEIDRRSQAYMSMPKPIPQDYWSKHDCKDYDSGNGICAWCWRAVEPEKLKIEITREQETFTREEIALVIKSVLAGVLEDMHCNPMDKLQWEKHLHIHTAEQALINVGCRLHIDDLLLDSQGDIIMRPSKYCDKFRTSGKRGE